jgi:hypothetical protein
MVFRMAGVFSGEFFLAVRRIRVEEFLSFVTALFTKLFTLFWLVKILLRGQKNTEFRPR